MSKTAQQRRTPAVEWAACLGLAAFALFLRLWRLGRPHEFAFDETYYAKDAWSLANHGYVRGYVEDADQQILIGQVQGLWESGPSMIVHPEVGKWLIAGGEKLFGMDPFGWRFASAVVGALMVLVMIRLARRVTGSLLLGLVAGLLMTLDGLHLVLSRLALLDLFVAFFSLLGVHCLVADRDWIRRRLVVEPVTSGSGPVVLWRPWLLATGLWFGLAVATKWSALYLVAAMGLLFWAWSAGARRRIGVRGAWWRSAVLDALPGFGYLVIFPALVYVATWTGWLLNAHEYEQALSNTQYGPYWGSYLETDAQGFWSEAWQSLRSLWHYHHDVFSFHTRFLNDATHTYQSGPAGWPLLTRPVGVAVELDIQPGDQGCAAAAGSTCLRQVLLLGTPLLWWFGALAVAWSAIRWVWKRDWRYGLVVVGFLATWLPWFSYDDRPIFSYYAIMMLPFLVLGATMLLGEILGRAGSSVRRRRIGAALAGTVVVAVAVNFAWFWPVWTYQLITHTEWLQRIWFERWI